MSSAIELKVAYMAGVIDSDGYITIHRTTGVSSSPVYAPAIGINQATSEAITLARDIFGGKVKMIDYTKAYAQGKRFSNKPMYSWFLPAPGQANALENLLPHLRIKRKQAEVLLRLREHMTFYPNVGTFLPPQAVVFREKLYQQMRGLNGHPVAETERESSSNEGKRQSDLHGNMQSAAEMTAPTKIGK